MHDLWSVPRASSKAEFREFNQHRGIPLTPAPLPRWGADSGRTGSLWESRPQTCIGCMSAPAVGVELLRSVRHPDKSPFKKGGGA